MQLKSPQTAADPRQMVAGQIQRSTVPSGKEQPLDRLAAMHRASVEGVNTMLNQNPQSLSHHNQGQAVQRMPFPPQSPGPPRQEHVQQTVYPVQGQRMPQTVPVLPGQRAAPQPVPVGVPGNVQSPQSQLPVSRSPLPPPRPIQPPVAQPSQTPPPTGFVPRASSLAEPPSYRSTAAYRQPAPPYTQQQNINIRPAPPAYNSRPAYHGSYPPLAPKPAPGTNVQLTQQSQVRNQLPSSGTPAPAVRYPSSPVVPSSPLQRQNFQPQTPPPNMPPSPLPSSTLASGQPFASSQHDLPGGFTGRNIRPKVAQDRQANRAPLTG